MISTTRGPVRAMEWTCCWCGEVGGYISRGAISNSCLNCSHSRCTNCDYGEATSGHSPDPCPISESVLPPPPPYSYEESGEWSLKGNCSPINSVEKSTGAPFHRQINQQTYFSIHDDLEELLRHCGQQFGSMPVDLANMLDPMTDLLDIPESNLMYQIKKRIPPTLNHSSNPQKQVTPKTHSYHMTSTTPLDCWSETPERHEYIAHRLSEAASSITEYQQEGSPYISDANKTPPFESFINNPAPYFEDVSSLEERVLHLGTSTFENISGSHGQSILPLPAFELDTRPFDRHRPLSDPLSFNFHHRHQSSSSLVSIEELVRIRIRASIETLSAIRGGVKLLHDQGFCSHQGYNIIVVDCDRPSVLNVRSISMQSLNVLSSLLCEVGASEITQLDPILEDIAEILSYVTGSLGLKISVMNDMQKQREKWQGICQSLSALLAVLHIALMSFIRSHIDISGAVPTGALGGQLQIEAPGGKICLAARRLKCLHGLLKQPVWAFNFVPTDSYPLEVDYDGFYISITVDDFADLWGPLRLNYAENSVVVTVASIETRNGAILAVDPIEHNVKALDDEIPCHWFSWLDVSEYQKYHDKVASTDPTKRLLIGMHGLYDHGQKHQKRRIRPKLEISEKCSCVDTYSLQYAEFELSTKIPSWTLDAKSFQVSGGKYATLTVGFTYKFDAGWTLKDAILESWINASKDDPSHVPNPHHMDYLVVLDICRCSGHARRISLWKLLQSPDLRDFFRRNLEFGVCQEIETVLLQYSTDDCFATIWPDLDKNKRSVFEFAFKSVLRILRCTGVGEDGLLQVWDITSMPRIDGRRIDPQWTRMVQDDIGCATFGIITKTCRKYKPPVRARDPLPKPVPVLYTQVCITAKKKLKKTEDTQKQWEVPSCVNESNLGGFSSKWSVSKSISKSNSTNTRLGDPPDLVQSNMEGKLLERIQARQKARKTTSGAARIFDFAGQSVLMESIQSSRRIQTDSTRIYDDTRSISSKKTQELGCLREKFPEQAICDVNLSFRNGKGQKVGRLLLEPLQGATDFIDLNSLTDISVLPARWEAVRLNLLDTLHEKEAAWDKSISSWARKSTGFIPSLIGRIAPEDDVSSPDVVEYIRPGNLTTYQKVLTTYIR